MLISQSYQKFISSFVFKLGFIVGSELVNAIQHKFKLQPAHARKVLQRAVESGVITSTSPISFGRGQFMYMTNGVKVDLDNIAEILRKYRPPLYRIVDVLQQNDGIISYYEALKLSSAPEEKTSTKATTVNELIRILTGLELVEIKTDKNDVRYIIDANHEDPESAMMSHYGRMMMDTLFIPDMLKFLRSINIIDNLKTVYRSKQNPAKGVVHNSLAWDAYGYTKTTGINDVYGNQANSIEKQTLVVIDVILAREYSQSDLDGFLGRIQVNINSVKNGRRKVIPIIFYKEASFKVYNSIAKLGFIAIDIGTLFGSKVKDIVEKISSFQKQLESKPEKAFTKNIDSLLSTIRDAGQEENLSNIKGVLFEFLLYPVLKSIYGNALIIHGKYHSRKLQNGEKEGYEYDFIIKSETPKEIIIVEAKGYSSESKIPLGDADTKNTLKWFFNRTLPFVKKQYTQELSEGYRFRACYITSADYFEDGTQYLQNQKKLKSQNLNVFYNGGSLQKLLVENNFIQSKTTLDKYFIKKAIAEE